MNLLALPQLRRNAKRFEEIARVLARYGLADFLGTRDPDFLSRLLGRNAITQELAGRTRPERIRLALTDLGPTFIKLGQMLSTRPDIVGPDLAAELEGLQSHARSDPYETVRLVVESELGAQPHELFASFDHAAFASGSIAQVHAATLDDGTRAVVKIQHEGIEAQIRNDLEILAALADLAEKHSTELALYRPAATVAEFRRQLVHELDFTREEHNQTQFRHNFETDPSVRIPNPIPQLSSRRVLTMERLDGIPIADAARLDSAGIDRGDLARRGVALFLEMIFRDRFYHADPHPGNLLVLENGVVGLLDCGMVGHLDPRTKEVFEGIFEAFLLKDSQLLADSALRLGTPPPDLDRAALETDLDAFVQEHLSTSVKHLDLARLLSHLTELIRTHRIRLNPGTSRLLKTIVVLEGTGHLLDPDFRLAEMLEPFYGKLAGDRLSPRSLLRRASRTLRDWDRLAQALPRDLGDILDRFRRGTLDVHLDHRNLDLVANRLAYSLLTAALFLGSTLLWANNIPPIVYQISLPGAAGSLAALYLAFKLLRSIQHSGGLAGPKKK